MPPKTQKTCAWGIRKIYIESNELPSGPHFSLDVAAAFLSVLQAVSCRSENVGHHLQISPEP